MYTWKELGDVEMTNLFLYGRIAKPSNLLDDALLRPKDATEEITMDAVSFMADGPGRFARGAQAKVVTDFMSGGLFAAKQGEKQTFTLSQAMQRSGEDSHNIAYKQYNYSDGTADHGSRTYQWNSSPFRVADDVVFVIEADGTRHIENFTIRPYHDDFDFKSRDTVAKFGNPWLKERIDPSGIGRIVKIVFDSASKNALARKDYRQEDFLNDQQFLSSTTISGTGALRLPLEMLSLVNALFDAGSTKFLDGSKPILYGSINSDVITGTRTLLGYDLASYKPGQPDVSSYVGNGITYFTGAGNDHITATSGNDKLIGGTGNDVLQGGAGNDVYVYRAGDGEDTIFDSDGNGQIIVGPSALSVVAAALSGASAKEHLRSGNLDIWTVNNGAVVYTLDASQKRLVITGTQLGADGKITIGGFDFKRSGGYLGIQLAVSTKVALQQNTGADPFALANFDPATLSGTTTIAEGGSSFYTLYLNQAAQQGDTLTLALSGLTDKFQAILGDSVVAANGAIITLSEGQTQVSFALKQTGDVDQDGSTQLSATYHGQVGGAVTAQSNVWVVALQDMGEKVRTYNGDQRGLLLGVEVETNIPAGDPRYNTYKWVETVWQTNGTLGGSTVEVGFNDVIDGSADKDRINGFGGNDALDGLAGNDLIDGGAGDDLIGGGAGADSIRGGDGNDVILSATGLKVYQRVGPNDKWAPPAGGSTWTSGSNWGTYRAQGSTYISGGGSTSMDSAGDAVDGGAGDDLVIGGLGRDFLEGGAGQDTLWGHGGDDAVEGGDGDDHLEGDGVNLSGLYQTLQESQGGDDFLDGGAGNDYLRGAGGNDVLYGGTGDDILWGDASNQDQLTGNYHGRDVLDGEDGDDQLAGGGAADTLYGGSGNDNLWGDSEDDVQLVGSFHGADLIDGEAGDDYVVGGGANDTLLGGSGADVLRGDDAQSRLAGNFHGDDYLDGDGGNDELVGGGGNDSLFGGADDDVLQGDDRAESRLAGDFHGNDLLNGGDGADELVGGGRDDTLYGGAGKDSLWGDNEEVNLGGTFHGSDYLDGGDGDDVLIGGGGEDTLVGGEGADELQGDASRSLLAGEFHSNDLLAGGGGNDRLFGMGRDDALSGGAGDDMLFGDGSLTDIDAAFHGNDYLNGDEGNDVLVGGGGNDVLSGGSGNDFLSGEDQLSTASTSALAGDDVLYGGDGNDTLLAGNGRNELFGDAGNDALWGGDGDDLLLGGDGDDLLRSGSGEDTLDGGAGNDTYYVKLGSGEKHIEEDAGDGSDWNVLVLEGGFNFNMARLSLGSLVIGTGDAASSIHLDGVDYDDLAGTSPIDEVRFSDGTSMTVAQLLDAVPIEIGATADTDYLRGTSGKEVIYALAGDDVVDGRGGDDVLDLSDGNDHAYGGDGNDTVTGGDGNDLVHGDAGADQLSGGAGNDQLRGGSGNDVLRGGDGDDQLNGDDGDDLLDGGSGADRLAGGAGDDTYIVTDAGDAVVEAAGQGRDRVRSAISLTLAAHVEDLVLEEGSGASTGAGNEMDNALTGNARDNLLIGLTGADTLSGAGGQDTLDGGTGSDLLSGGQGDDLYFVDASDDRVIEQAGEGRDTVIASADFSLGDQVETLTMAGSAVRGTGNAQGNTLFGNALDNVLDGRGGDDLVQGGAGNDQLLGGGGSDTLVGGIGDDLYEVDETGDIVIEQTGEGIDTIRSSASLTLSENVENLVLTGSYDINATGNALDNQLTGNAGSNRLDGGSGVDTLVGGEGDDTYVLDVSEDVIIEAADQGRDTVEVSFSYTAGHNVENVRLTGYADINGTGDAGDNRLEGNAGRNILDGGAGRDTLAGGQGDDVYLVDDEGDRVEEVSGQGRDTVVRSFDTTYVLADAVENLILSGDVYRGNGNDLDNLILGNDADNNLLGLGGSDTLMGGAGDDALFGSEGVDSLVGGSGDDYYEIDDANDIIVEEVNEGDDFIQSSVSWTLGANLERLALVGGDNNNAAGNDLDNGLWGNYGDNVLIGGKGNDFLSGGAGNDVYVFNRGDGQDSVDTTDTLEAIDTLRMGADISDNDLLAFRSGSHLFFKVKGSSDQIGFINYYASANSSEGGTVDQRIDRVQFANGVVWNQAMIQAVVDRANNNRAPTVNSYLPTLNAKVGSAFSFTVPLDTITDPDSWDSITYSITLPDGSAIPAWMHFDAQTRTIWGTPGTANLGTLQLVLWGTDNYNYATGESVTLKVGPANRAPVLNTALPDKSAAQGAPLTFALAATSFTDADGDNLTYSATLGDGGALPDWLKFNASTRTFSGTPPVAGTVSVKVTATDGSGASASDVFDLVTTLQNLVLTGTANADTLTGGSGNDSINGAAGGDVLIGNAGQDTLIGGTGNDTMAGGSGDDTYGVDSVSDVIAEVAGEGVDSVQSAVSFTLGANVENLSLTGTASLAGTGNELNNQLTGSSGNDRLTGLAGDDRLDGGAGSDTLVGGYGNDIYIVNVTSDVITENVNEGIDSVQATVTWTLGSGLENLMLGGTSALSGTGNQLNNLLTGNSANNTLTGLAGNDTLDGGAGTDTLVGGAGDDTYIVNIANDVVTENTNQGLDAVQSTVTWTLGANFESLTLIGGGAINGTGNSLANTLVGNSGANVLTGAAGDDVYDGGAGNDTFTDAVTTSNDTYRWGIGAGVDNLTDAGGALDHVDLGAGITKGQLRFVRTANDLELSITGQSDKLTIKQWYAGSTNQIEEFRMADGTKVLASEVQGLLGAMATFAASDTGTLSAQQQPLLAVPIFNARDELYA